MLAAVRSLWLIGTLAVVATLWLTLLSGGAPAPAVKPGATTGPTGAARGATAASGYSGAIGAADSAVQQTNQDAQRAATSAPTRGADTPSRTTGDSP
jgi:hypothetical protein